jgi:hypothetical protein
VGILDSAVPYLGLNDRVDVSVAENVATVRAELIKAAGLKADD